MAGPWEEYATPAARPPWEEYAAPSTPPPPLQQPEQSTPAADPYALPKTLPALTRGPQDNGFLGTAAVRGGQALLQGVLDPLSWVRHLVSPRLEEIEQQGKPQPARVLADAAQRAIGPAYEPTTSTGRLGMGAATGAAAGAPFGPPGMAIGGIGGLLGEAARQYGPDLGLSPENTERLATAAAIMPGVFLAAKRPQPEVPTARELVERGGAGFDATRASGVQVRPDPFVSMAQRMETDLFNRGFAPDLIPSTSKILSELQAVPAPGASPRMDFTTMHALRQRLQNVIEQNAGGANPNKQEVAAARSVLNEVNTIIGELGQNPTDLVAGTTPQAAAEAAGTFRTALGNYAAGQKSNAITGELDRARTGLLERAEARAAAANSGRNFDNSLRQRVESFLENRRNVLGLNDAEIGLLDDVVRGSRTQNFLRSTGNLLGGGGGLGQMLTMGAGAFTGGAAGKSGTMALAGAVAPVIAGTAAKSFENALARRNLNQANTAMLMNSPEFQQRLAAMPPRDAAVLEGLVRGGLIGGLLGGR